MDTRRDATHFFANLAGQDVVRLTLSDSSVIEGSYLTQAGMHFFHVKDGSLIGKVVGPVDPGDVTAFELVKSREEVFEDRRERRLGEPVPGRLVETRDGYEARLERLANTAAREPEFRRRMEIEAQFEDVADRISLARTKRNWMLAVARWRLRSNEEPDKLLMAGGDLTMAERLQRPRPQDFDPDPVVRRRRPVLPPHIAEDPISPPNMMKALRAAGFKARVSVISEMTEDGVDLLVDFPGGKKAGRFSVRGRRVGSSMQWSAFWDGGIHAASLTRMRKCKASAEYDVFREVLERGLGAALTTSRATESDDEDTTPLPRFGR